jgi:hypothetical protein
MSEDAVRQLRYSQGLFKDSAGYEDHMVFYMDPPASLRPCGLLTCAVSLDMAEPRRVT